MKKILLLAWLSLAAPACADDMAFSISPDGVAIQVNGFGRLLVPPPSLSLTDTDYNGGKPQVSMEDPGTLLAKYSDTFQVRMTLGADGKSIEFRMSSAPPSTTGGLRISMQIPIETAHGGKFAFNSDGLKPLPDAPPVKGQEKLAALDAKIFRVVSDSGAGVSLTMPQSWQSLEDDRIYDWSIFEYHYLYDFKRYQDLFFPLSFEFIPPDATSAPASPAKAAGT